MVSIIIIDSDKFIVKELEFGFRQHNIKCFIIQDPDEGLKITKKNSGSLIILELVLPRGDGFEVLEIKTKDPDLVNVPVFVYSKLIQESDRKKALSLGAAEYWSKSEYSPEEVVKKVVKFIMDKLTDK